MGDNKKYAVIVAGGKGTRMGNAMPKQFLDLNGKPVLSYSIQTFVAAFPDIQIILVLPPDMLSYANMVLQALPRLVDIVLVPGGDTRFQSVKNGLAQIEGKGIVFIHDGARPLLSTDLVHRCYEMATQSGSAIPVVPVAESLRMINDEGSQAINRDHMRIVQTPQTFRTEIVVAAFQQEYRQEFTDEATVVEHFGMPVSLVEGDKKNIKLTTPEDMVIAQAFMGIGH